MVSHVIRMVVLCVVVIQKTALFGGKVPAEESVKLANLVVKCFKWA